jgi:nucleoside-diphosphate-sugar epimerase
VEDVKVFVTGGTGAMGRHAVTALVQGGHTVTALARTPEKAALLAHCGASPWTGSIFDRGGLIKALAGHEAVVNLATAIPPVSRFTKKNAWRDDDRIRMEGSATIVDAAMASGVTRLVQESVVMFYRDHGAAWIDEYWPTDTFPMSLGNHAAEANANRFSASGRSAVVLRFGWFYGPGATHSEQFLALARRHICVMMGRADGYVSSIHVTDGATAVVAALAIPSGTYNVVDDEPLTKRGYADALANAAGKRAWIKLPGRLALLFGNGTTSLTRSLRVSNRHLRNTAGWVPRYPSAREGWSATVAMLK